MKAQRLNVRQLSGTAIWCWVLVTVFSIVIGLGIAGILNGWATRLQAGVIGAAAAIAMLITVAYLYWCTIRDGQPEAGAVESEWTGPKGVVFSSVIVLGALAAAGVAVLRLFSQVPERLYIPALIAATFGLCWHWGHLLWEILVPKGTGLRLYKE